MGILDRFGLDGKVAVVTGASSGLGVAMARGLAEAGADVIVAARRTDLLAATQRHVEETGKGCLAVTADVTRPEDCARVVDSAVARFGQVDVLINNAGLGWAVRAVLERPEDFTRVIEVNLMGVYWMAQACGRVMPRGSSIVNIGSVLGHTTLGLPQAAYSASKAGVAGLTRDLAQQWTGRKGIRVNALAPGLFATEMTDDYAEGYIGEMVERRVLASRVGTLEECAAAAIFLASDASSYITGVVLPVDGGLLAT